MSDFDKPTPASDVAPVAISQSTQRMAEILGTEWRAHPPLAQSVDPVAGHANTERDAIELFAHLNCPSCGGSGHIDDVTVDPVAGEALRATDCLDQILNMDPSDMVKSPSFVRSLVREALTALAALKGPAA